MGMNGRGMGETKSISPSLRELIELLVLRGLSTNLRAHSLLTHISGIAPAQLVLAVAAAENDGVRQRLGQW